MATKIPPLPSHAALLEGDKLSKSWLDFFNSIRAGVNAGYFVSRGDPSGFDFTKTNLTLDDAWHDLDLSAIVPAGANAVVIRTTIYNVLITAGVQYRKNGNANEHAVLDVITLAANSANYVSGIVPCDTGRIIEYQTISGAANPADAINIVVTGWFIGF